MSKDRYNYVIVKECEHRSSGYIDHIFYMAEYDTAEDAIRHFETLPEFLLETIEGQVYMCMFWLEYRKFCE